MRGRRSIARRSGWVSGYTRWSGSSKGLEVHRCVRILSVRISPSSSSYNILPGFEKGVPGAIEYY